MSIAIQAQALTRSFGDTRALDGIDLEVPSGTVLGLLGPNGSGKTTAVRILATLLPPSSGRASVGGFDVVRQAPQVRTVIGLTGQYAAVDGNLTGVENLELIGRLLDLSRSQARHRAVELIERLDFADAGRRLSKTYSGGMRRRLDLAASLVGRPRVLFLDEPTTGLDPRSRIGMWAIIRELVADGTAVLLTTQYLEEADQLADEIAVLDLGRVIAAGTSDELKRRIGGQVLEVRTVDPVDLDAVAAELAALTGDAPSIDRATRLVKVPAQDTVLVAAVVRRLDEVGIVIADLALRRPSLDDVFLQLIGRRAAMNEPATSAA
ncbi:MAG: ATP-binding cassette domain-containing protein [Pseudonocardiales bacterium]|nr:ATP-binding cassette domain-containing protein [Pseudonocardiales bacterium]MBV9032269.1 ATP-binding cassette domain-containing protein [Pseudonocardiales bacterium]MBW0010916.1 ATP-binding cassette domain-containing protein [Pseudonocardiales bacterium]